MGLKKSLKGGLEPEKDKKEGKGNADEDSGSGKRKRESFTEMLNWVGNVAKNPCSPTIGLLPERNRWKHYGGELPWKQILLAREAMLLKKNVVGSSEHNYWQKTQKMHPSMYADQSSSDKLRHSQRLLVAKDSSRKKLSPEPTTSGSLSNDDSDDQANSTADAYTFWFSSLRRKKIPVGPDFQAKLPRFQGNDSYESDSKWLGSRNWPLDKTEQMNSNLIERDRIGKGRDESCGCQFRGSVECVKFHISEKRKKIKLELGWAFFRWKFDNMGEEVALFWKRNEQNSFEEIVKSNPLSSEKYFWNELFKFFPQKGREALVSYYFNVFLIRRRAHQNRSDNSEIDSDVEEGDYGPVGNRFGRLSTASPGSIFHSPKKSSLNSK